MDAKAVTHTNPEKSNKVKKEKKAKKEVRNVEILYVLYSNASLRGLDGCSVKAHSIKYSNGIMLDARRRRRRRRRVIWKWMKME